MPSLPEAEEPGKMPQITTLAYTGSSPTCSNSCRIVPSMPFALGAPPKRSSKTAWRRHLKLPATRVPETSTSGARISKPVKGGLFPTQCLASNMCKRMLESIRQRDHTLFRWTVVCITRRASDPASMQDLLHYWCGDDSRWARLQHSAQILVAFCPSKIL